MMTPTVEKLYVRNPGYATANLGEELAVLDMASGSYFGLNATAAELWHLLDRPQPLESLCRTLQSGFEVDADRCRVEVLALLERLCAAGLVCARNAEAE